MLNIPDFLNSHPYAATTRKKYTYCLNRLARDHPDLSTLDASTLLAWLDAQGWGNQMRWLAFSAIRAYLRWCYGDTHPALQLKIPRIDSGPQRTIDKFLAARIMASFDTETDYGIRDLAIASLMIDTGLRNIEICRLEVSRVELAAHSLSVLCKGNKWDFALYSAQTAANLAAWIEYRKPLAVPGVKSLFISIKGLTPGYGITTDGLRAIVRRWGITLGVKISPHDFRRGMAVISTQQGAPSRLVQLAGRWSSIKMVERYTRSLEIQDFAPYLPTRFINPDDYR